MTAVELHPEVLTKNGEKFAILPYDEFVKVQELLEDLHDSALLDEAREEHKNAEGIPVDDLLKNYNLTS